MNARWSRIWRYPRRHWRGLFSLTRSFWLNGVALSLALYFGIPFIGHRSFEWTLRDQRILFMAISAVTSCVATWQWGGVWRAAARPRVGATARWTARGCAGFAAFSLWTACRLLFQGFDDTMVHEPFRVRALGKTGEEAEFSGTISDGASASLRAFLKRNPRVRLLHMNSPGGLVNESLRLAALVGSEGLDVVIDHKCESGCTFVLLASQRRWARSNARIGFHRARGLGATGGSASLADEYLSGALTKVGASQDFIDQALITPNREIFAPDMAILMAQHVVTGLASDEQFVYCPVGDSRSAIETWLTGDTLLVAIRTIDPAAFASIVDEYERAPGEGTSLATLLRLEERVKMAAVKTAKCPASLEAAKNHLVFIQHLLEATAGRFPERCKEVILGNYDTNGLPESMVTEESRLLAEQIVDGRLQPAERPSAEDYHRAALMLSNAMSKDTRNALGAIVDGEPIDDQTACAAGIDSFKTVAKLPAPQLIVLAGGRDCVAGVNVEKGGP